MISPWTSNMIGSCVGVLVRHGSWTLLLDRLSAWLVRDGRVIAGIRWWR